MSNQLCRLLNMLRKQAKQIDIPNMPRKAKKRRLVSHNQAYDKRFAHRDNHRDNRWNRCMSNVNGKKKTTINENNKVFSIFRSDE